MIDKSGEYWHLYFNESCDDNPEQILTLVTKLFAEIDQMGDVWLMRAKPGIDVWDDFEGGRTVNVACRFSAKPSITVEGTKLVAIGVTPVKPVEYDVFPDGTPATTDNAIRGLPLTLCGKCRQWYDGEHVCLTLTVTDLKRELANVNALLAQRNIVIGEMGQEIERLRTRLARAVWPNGIPDV